MQDLALNVPISTACLLASPLNRREDGIAYRLDNMSNDITASYAYVDGGIKGGTTTFGTATAIFNGEDFTRGQFMYLAPVPVPPAAWLFGSGLPGLVGMARRKKIV